MFDSHSNQHFRLADPRGVSWSKLGHGGYCHVCSDGSNKHTLVLTLRVWTHVETNSHAQGGTIGQSTLNFTPPSGIGCHPAPQKITRQSTRLTMLEIDSKKEISTTEHDTRSGKKVATIDPTLRSPPTQQGMVRKSNLGKN